MSERSEMEGLLREALDSRVAAAPSADGLLPRLRSEHRRRTRRNTAALGCALAAVLAIGVPVALRPLLDPSSTGTVGATTPVPTSSAPRSDVWLQLTAGPLTVPAFPLVPSHTIPGLGSPTAILVGGVGRLEYRAPQTPGLGLTVAVGTAEPTHPDATSCAPTGSTVHGSPAVRCVGLGTGVPEWTLSWREPTGLWVDLTVRGEVPEAEVAAYAEGLGPGSLPVPVPFTFTAVPQNLVLDGVDSSAVWFRPERVPGGFGFEGKLVVLYGSERPVLTNPTGGAPFGNGNVTFDTTSETEGAATIASAEIPGKGFITVQIAPGIRGTQTDLVRFVAGIGVTSTAVPGNG